MNCPLSLWIEIDCIIIYKETTVVHIAFALFKDPDQQTSFHIYFTYGTAKWKCADNIIFSNGHLKDIIHPY